MYPRTSGSIPTSTTSIRDLDSRKSLALEASTKTITGRLIWSMTNSDTILPRCIQPMHSQVVIHNRLSRCIHHSNLQHSNSNIHLNSHNSSYQRNSMPRKDKDRDGDTKSMVMVKVVTARNLTVMIVLICKDKCRRARHSSIPCSTQCNHNKCRVSHLSKVNSQCNSQYSLCNSQ